MSEQAIKAILGVLYVVVLSSPVWGMAVGLIAAKVKRWNPLVGLIGGLLLAILSPLMFLCKANRTCPQCAEAVKEKALVCRHCGFKLASGNATAPLYARKSK